MSYRLQEALTYLPITDHIAAEILSLPMHPWLTDEEIKEVTEAVKSGTIFWN
jgi:dTDP-4-amino-4,6-dideoxygalactose transaminase